MVMADGKVFVCQVDSSQLLVIDAASDQVIDKLATAKSPQYIELDKNGNVWVSCSGDQGNNFPALQQFNSTTLQLMKTLPIESSNQFLSEIAMNGDKDELFFINQLGLGKVGIDDSSLVEKAIIPANNRILYAMNIDPKTNEIYLADAIDYQQRGVVYRYNGSGSLMSHFRVGIIPGSIYFKN
jgi:DNA-binding beta-propeller fold protein YncE